MHPTTKKILQLLRLRQVCYISFIFGYISSRFFFASCDFLKLVVVYDRFLVVHNKIVCHSETIAVLKGCLV